MLHTELRVFSSENQFRFVLEVCASPSSVRSAGLFAAGPALVEIPWCAESFNNLLEATANHSLSLEHVVNWRKHNIHSRCTQDAEWKSWAYLLQLAPPLHGPSQVHLPRTSRSGSASGLFLPSLVWVQIQWISLLTCFVLSMKSCTILGTSSVQMWE